MNTTTITIDPRPLGQRLVGGRAWAETDGTLRWVGAPPAPAPPKFQDDALVVTRRAIRRDAKRLPVGTVCRVLSHVVGQLYSVAPLGPDGASKSAFTQPWLLHVSDLLPAEDAW